MKDEKPKPNKKTKKLWVWPVFVLLLAIGLSLVFSIVSEMVLSRANIIVAVIVILVFILIAMLFDMIGLAVASCAIEPFTAMSARKVKGAKQALSLIKNAGEVSSVCADVIGDVCGILSGAAGASIVAKIVLQAGSFMEILVPSLISAIIAGLTIFGKACLKHVARTHATEITLGIARILNFFTRKD